MRRPVRQGVCHRIPLPIAETDETDEMDETSQGLARRPGLEGREGPRRHCDCGVARNGAGRENGRGDGRGRHGEWE